MKIKKIQAKSFAEALAKVKEELSEDAIILSTEEKKGPPAVVEVTAAVDFDLDSELDSASSIKQSVAFAKHLEGRLAAKEDKVQVSKGQKKKDELKAPIANSPVPKPLAPQSAATLSKDEEPVKGEPSVNPNVSTSTEIRQIVNEVAQEIRNEIETLRDTIVDMKNVGFEMTLPPKKKSLLYFLKERAIKEEYALLLCEKATDVEDIAELIVSNIKVKKIGMDMKSIMLIGPTGVGKTTTIAKLAAHAIREGKKTTIINLDTYRIGAVEQSRIYSRILGIPLSVVSSPRELKSTLSRAAETRDLIFIDTAGRNPRDEQYIETLSEICETDVPIEVHLLISANSDDETMIDSYRYYRKLPVNYIAFTKVDEAVRFGSLYNILLTYQKPVAYITTGQNVPNDIEFARVDRLANLILKKGAHYK